MTSAAQLARKEAPILKGHIRTGKRMVLAKKRKSRVAGKPIAPGERKAFRKRIVLSNNNALDVPGFPELTTELMTNPDSVGKIASLPGELVDQLRTVEAFKPTQNWGLFRSPHMLIRKETVELTKKLVDDIQDKKTVRMVVDGKRSSGKSMLGLQAMAAGLMNKWVVINLPEGNDLVEARTEYSTIENSEQFSQPVYLLKLMQAIVSVNGGILHNEKVQMDWIHLPINVPRGMRLSTLCLLTKEPEFAWPVFHTLWQELLLPGRPPILFTLDGLCHIMRVSDYRSPAFELIHSHDLAALRLFVEALGGKTEFPNGAGVLGINTRGNAPIIKSMDLALLQADAIQQGLEPPPRDPFYMKYDERVFGALEGVNVMNVGPIDKPGARALMEYWAASGILRMRIDERNVSERWTLAGNGILGELEKVSLYSYRL